MVLDEMVIKTHFMENIEKNRQSHLGKKASDETKLKMSLSRKGKKRKPLSEAHKNTISNS